MWPGCMSRTGPCFLNSLALPFKSNMQKKEGKVLGKKFFLDFFKRKVRGLDGSFLLEKGEVIFPAGVSPFKSKGERCLL